MKTETSFNILFLGGGKRVSLAHHLKEAALARGFQPAVFSYELTRTLPIAEEATILIGRRWNDPELMNDLIRTIRQNHISMVLPFVDPAIEVAALLAEKHLPGVYIPCPGAGICRIMFDKIQSDDWFAAQGIPRPERYTNLQEIKYPAILKPRNGSASKGICVIHSQSELEAIKKPEDYLIQHYIADRNEYTVDCFVDSNGKIMSIVPRERLEVAGGEVTVSKTIRDETCIRLSRQLLEKGELRGPITIQFIRDQKTGETFIMEVNPRLGGGVIASICAGSGILYTMVDECVGNSPQPTDEWKENTLMTRYMKEVIFYADHH